ncbi:MAG TPA: Wzz/FepE/Etk N-terminal domain-containing protein [Pyrinomonadaceae bacterium]
MAVGPKRRQKLLTGIRMSHVSNFTLREIVTTLFRRKWLLLGPLALITAATIALATFLPDRYQSRMKILVKNTRADAVITTDANSANNGNGEITESQINSEIALLTSKDLLEQVVIQSGLDKVSGSSFLNRKLPPIERAVLQLEKDLEIEAAKKSAIIEVRYTASSPETAATVLQVLANLYFEKHLKLHSPPGAQEFFQNQTNQYGEQLAAAERNLSAYQRQQDFVSLEQEKQLNLQKLAEVRARHLDAEGALKDTGERIAKLQQQVETLPARIATQNRALPNQYSLERLSTMLVELKNKRTQLLTRLRPDDRLVTEVDQQIKDTSEALEQARKISNVEQSSDVNPLRQNLEMELAKARMDLAGQKARRDDLTHQLAEYQARLERLDQATTQNADLQRQLKTSEENYQLYAKKKEEARIADEMDQNKITNVTLAEKPILQRTAVSPNRRLILGLGLLLAVFVSLTIVLVTEFWRDTVHTPRELELVAEIPVIGTFRYQPASAGRSGTGS